jgi:adenylate cyclase, class 2
MKYEPEQKLRVVDLRQFEQSLDELGCKLNEEQLQLDTYFSHPSRDFRKTDEVLRLRSDGQSNFLTYKGRRVDDTTKTRPELEIALPNGQDVAAEVLELWRLLGFATLISVKKIRRTGDFEWQNMDFTVALDQVEELGAFVELEIMADDSNLMSAKEKLASLAVYLGLTDNELRSYSELMFSLAQKQ